MLKTKPKSGITTNGGGGPANNNNTSIFVSFSEEKRYNIYQKQLPDLMKNGN